MKHVRKLIANIENLDIRFSYWILLFFSIMIGRIFLGSILGAEQLIGYTPDFIHSLEFSFLHLPAFFISLFMGLVLFTSLLTREKIEKVAKLLCTFCFIILLPPLIDGILKTTGYQLPYISDMRKLPEVLFYLFHPGKHIPTLSPGVRIEIIVGALLFGFYIYAKTKRILKGTAGFIGLIIITVFLIGAPALFAGAFSANFENVFNSAGLISSGSRKFALLYLIIIVILLFISLRVFDRRKFATLMKCIRPSRTLIYSGMTVIGMLVGFKIFNPIYAVNHPANSLAFLGVYLVAFFGLQGSILLNNFFDKEIDKISGQKNPLLEGILSSSDVTFFIVLYFLISFTFALACGYATFLIALFCFSLSFLYSAPPLRLKRFYPLSTFTLGLSALFLLILGYSIFASINAISMLPKPIVILVLITFTLTFSIKDIKDIKGDTMGKFYSIPVLFGEKRGKYIIAFLTLIAYILIPVILYIPLFFVFTIPCGILSFFLIIRRDYKEKYVWFVYLAFVFIFMVILWNYELPALFPIP